MDNRHSKNGKYRVAILPTNDEVEKYIVVDCRTKFDTNGTTITAVLNYEQAMACKQMVHHCRVSKL